MAFKTLTAAALGATVLAPAAAQAQDAEFDRLLSAAASIWLDRDDWDDDWREDRRHGWRGEDRHRGYGRGIGRSEAIAVARSQGMMRIEDIEREDGGWEIEGRDRYGRELEIEIGWDGQILELERD